MKIFELWRKKLHTRQDPVFGDITFDGAYWTARLDSGDRLDVRIWADREGPTKKQTEIYIELSEMFPTLMRISLEYLASQLEYRDSIGGRHLYPYAIDVADKTTDDCDFILEFSPDGDEVYGVEFLDFVPVRCYLHH